MADKTDVKKLNLLQRVKQLERQNADLAARIDRLEIGEQEADDEWTLDVDQMVFMLQHHNAIEAAYDDENMEFLRDLADSDEYKSIFGDTSFDEAYDRYETICKETDGQAV
jgi:predicted  nucleic acid-binding Zn-ribbon protein